MTRAGTRRRIGKVASQFRSRLGLATAVLSTLSGGDRRLASDWLARIVFDDTGRLP